MGLVHDCAPYSKVCNKCHKRMVTMLAIISAHLVATHFVDSLYILGNSAKCYELMTCPTFLNRSALPTLA